MWSAVYFDNPDAATHALIIANIAVIAVIAALTLALVIFGFAKK